MRGGPEGLAQDRPDLPVSARLFVVAALAAGLSAEAADKLGGGGDGTLYYAGRPNKIFIMDEATLKPAGEIALKNGLATSLSLSQDRKRFPISTGWSRMT